MPLPLNPILLFFWILILSFCDFFIWMTPFPTGDDVDDRYFLSQFHSGTAFLAFPALPDWLLFYSNLYSCSCKRIRSSLLLKSIWSSSILSILFSKEGQQARVNRWAFRQIPRKASQVRLESQTSRDWAESSFTRRRGKWAIKELA